MRTPRAAARSIAPATISRAPPCRWKSYCARSSVVRASSMKAAIQPATSAAGWPPSVRVRTVRAGFVTRLRCARIGATYNFYRDGARAPLLRERVERYLDERAATSILLVAEAPGYRGTRVSGIPLTSERQLTGTGAAEATATVVHRVLEEARSGRRRPALERRPDPPRQRALEPAADAGRGRRRTAVRA